jgi:hypothetical protein
MNDVARYTRSDIVYSGLEHEHRHFVDARDYDALLSRVQALEGYKAAIISTLMINHGMKAEHETDPRQALADLVHIECEMALDARISERARLTRYSRPAVSWVFIQTPPDWQLVPCEPTPQMVAAPFAGKVEAQCVSTQTRSRQQMAENYKAMIDHAPVSTMGDIYAYNGVPARKKATQMVDGLMVLSLRDVGWNAALDLIAGQTELELTDALKRILNFPEFVLQVVAAGMQNRGIADFGGILDRSKVLHWMLSIYLHHGENWVAIAAHELGEGSASEMLRRHQ